MRACQHAYMPALFLLHENMRNRLFIWTLVLSFLFSSYSCSQSKKVSSGTEADRSYDNSEYVLRTQRITVEGVGMSLDYNTAQFKSLADAREVLLDTMVTIVGKISARRDFNTSMPSEFYVSALRHVKYFDDKAYNDNGEWMYRSTCTVEVMILPMLQSLYNELHLEPEYGYYQFLRDVDLILMSHKKQ